MPSLTSPPLRRPAAVQAAACSLALLVLPLSAGCASKTPEQRIAETRGEYQANLNGFIVRDVPTALDVEVVTPEGPDEAAAAATEAELMDEAEHLVAVDDLPAEPQEGPRTVDVVLDIQLHHTADEALPGITLDVTQADEAERPKATYRVWVETARVARGQHVQLNHVLEGIEFAPGDRFAAEVRHPVPVGERAEYREFAPAAQ